MAVLETPADGPRRKGPFYAELYFQVLFAIFLGGLIGFLFPLNSYLLSVDPATGMSVTTAFAKVTAPAPARSACLAIRCALIWRPDFRC